MNIKIKKIHNDAVIPSYGTEGSACFDLTTVDSGFVNNTQVYGTGLQFEIPKNHVMLIFSRSGMAFKEDVRLSNCVGVIDSDYRGEVKIKLRADGHKVAYNKGDRIAQGLILPCEQVDFTVVEELEDTDRGAKGFGSTG